MKKIILTAIVIAFTFNALAQESFFGIDAGINLADEKSSDYTITSVTAGVKPSVAVKPTLGFFYQVGFTNTSGIRFGLRYMGMGYNQKGDFLDKIDINYLTLPITYQLSLSKDFSLNAGIYLSDALGGTNYNGQSIVSNVVKKNDFGLSCGMEFNISKNVGLAVNYFYGIENTSVISGVQFYNRALQFTLNYKFKRN